MLLSLSHFTPIKGRNSFSQRSWRLIENLNQTGASYAFKREIVKQVTAEAVTKPTNDNSG